MLPQTESQSDFFLTSCARLSIDNKGQVVTYAPLETSSGILICSRQNNIHTIHIINTVEPLRVAAPKSLPNKQSSDTLVSGRKIT